MEGARQGWGARWPMEEHMEPYRIHDLKWKKGLQKVLSGEFHEAMCISNHHFSWLAAETVSTSPSLCFWKSGSTSPRDAFPAVKCYLGILHYPLVLTPNNVSGSNCSEILSASD